MLVGGRPEERRFIILARPAVSKRSPLSPRVLPMAPDAALHFHSWSKVDNIFIQDAIISEYFGEYPCDA
ncbi:protein of unknown function [Aminobacter niigataensis]|nr:protein of unknown function [Aminobacter niigataensis]